MDEASSLMNLTVLLSVVSLVIFLVSLLGDVTYGNSAYAPLQSLRAQALSFDVPPQRHQTLGRNVDICIGLESIESAVVLSPSLCAF